MGRCVQSFEYYYHICVITRLLTDQAFAVKLILLDVHFLYYTLKKHCSTYTYKVGISGWRLLSCNVEKLLFFLNEDIVTMVLIMGKQRTGNCLSLLSR